MFPSLVSLVAAQWDCVRFGFLMPVLAFSVQPGPIVMPVDNAEMLRVAMQYNLVRLVTGNFYYEEIHEQLTPPHDDSVRVLDVISNSPW